jgi:hypothetical protein
MNRVMLSSKVRELAPSGSDVGRELNFWCPGCKATHSIWVEAGTRPSRNVWQWNGDAERPTFSPSLLVQREMWTPPVTPENIEQWRREPWEQTKVPHVCHSFVRDGQWQFLSDCTHELARQTVDIPDYPGVKD